MFTFSVLRLVLRCCDCFRYVGYWFLNNYFQAWSKILSKFLPSILRSSSEMHRVHKNRKAWKYLHNKSRIFNCIVRCGLVYVFTFFCRYLVAESIVGSILPVISKFSLLILRGYNTLESDGAVNVDIDVLSPHKATFTEQTLWLNFLYS